MTVPVSRVAGVALCLLTAACGPRSAASSTASAASASIEPADPKLAKIYDTTCRSCHGMPGNAAPPAGNRDAWAPRVAQGLPTLLAHTLGGYRGMPPLGSCSDCNEKDFTALIRFMSAGEGAATP